MGVTSSFEKPVQKYASMLPSHCLIKTLTDSNTSSYSSHGFVWDDQNIIGVGEFSVVYRGFIKQTGTPVAVKKISIRHLSDTRKQRILKEIRFNKYVNLLPNSSDYFVKFIDAFTDQHKNVFIITELISGCELFEIASSRPKGTQEELVRKMVRQIVLAVSILHKNDVAHRDIKLENIMYDKEGKRLKLIDFGFAMKTTKTAPNGRKHQLLSKVFCGSVHYVSPEIVKEIAYDAKKADIWAIGVVTYTLLTGHFPFEHPSHQVVLQMITTAPLKLPENISEEGKDFLSILLKRDPSSRSSISDVLAHPWLS